MRETIKEFRYEIKQPEGGNEHNREIFRLSDGKSLGTWHNAEATHVTILYDVIRQLTNLDPLYLSEGRTITYPRYATKILVLTSGDGGFPLRPGQTCSE